LPSIATSTKSLLLDLANKNLLSNPLNNQDYKKKKLKLRLGGNLKDLTLCLSGKVNNVECLFFYLHGEAIKFDKD
jgi:hypothetical protein